MDDRESEFKEIVNQFALWERRLSLLSSVNLNDLSLFSEYYAKELLNLTLNFNFVNANSIQANFPAVDLVDIENKTAVQVTSTKSASKIQKTINRFHEHDLASSFDRLIILVLGKKQRNYKNLEIPATVPFNVSSDIIDFNDLVKIIHILPSKTMSKINAVFIPSNSKKKSNITTPVRNIQKALNVKKRIKKDLQNELPREQWEYSRYEPWIKFTYHNLILRDPADTSFPEVDTRINRWLKVECWDFYDRGLEFIFHGGDAVFDQDGYWDILSFDDPRKENPNYEIRPYNIFARLEYLNIATYDMEHDAYYSMPTIYCTFCPEKEHPFSEILYGHAGSASSKRWTYIFESHMRKKEGWDL